MWWTRIVTEYPSVLVISVFFLNWGLILISLLNESLPSFEDPLLGFEVRGTEISDRTNAWKLLLQSTSSNGILSLQPKANTSLKSIPKDLSTIEEEELKTIEEDIESKPFLSRNHNLSQNEFFCGKILEDYAQIIISSVDGRDLLSLESIKTLCRIDQNLLRFESIVSENPFKKICEIKNSGNCCKSWSLHNYVLLLAKKDSCDQINEADIKATKSLLERCAPFYHNLQINEDCLNEPTLCRNADKECFRGENGVFHLMHYLIDDHFLSPKNPKQSKIKSTNIFLPIAKSTQLLEYFEHLSEQSLEMDGIEVVAMDLGLKQTLFDRYLLCDTIYLIIAFFVILFSLYFYTTSLIVTIVTVMTIITSLGTAYFCYTQLFRMKFFPFMNLLAIVIAIGIGSDNALIFCKIWGTAKSQSNQISGIKLVTNTISDAWMSILTASATTSLALFAGYFSDITSIKCFSVFASTSVAINFVITLLTLPSAVIIAEKFSFCDSFSKYFQKLHSVLSFISKKLFEEIFFKIISKFRYIIVGLMGITSIVSIIAVIYRPQLQLPDSEEFQIFRSNHYFERYDFEFKNQFWFKRVRTKNEDFLYYLPIRVVFGVRAQDNGDRLNPWSRGSLQLETDFDISSEESQLWLIDFCKKIRKQSFYRPTTGPLLSNCFIETFKDWMENRKCIDTINGFDRTPCCNISRFPYKSSVFNLCINKVIDLLDKTPNYYLAQDWAGPRFDKKSLQMVSAVIEYDSNYSFSHSFVEMNNFWNEVNDWISHKIKTAPNGLNKGWFVSSYLDFYALQLSLSNGTIKSIAFAVFFSFLALIFTTYDLKLSVLSIITISSTIFSTIAILVALNWKLNVLESISISLAIGLAIDFTLHYTIAFKQSAKEENRINGIHYTLVRSASPIAMAALTTCMAGLLMLFSSILAYVQIGTFMVVLSLMSWFYSTFFHLSLLSILETVVPQTQSRSISSKIYSFFTFKQSSERSDPLRRSTSESITSGQKINGSVTNGGLSISSSSSPTNSSFQFQNQNECHELEKMIKT